MAAEVRRTIAKHPNAVAIKNFVLKFEHEGDTAEEPASEGQVARSKAAWFGIVGLKKPPT